MKNAKLVSTHAIQDMPLGAWVEGYVRKDGDSWTGVASVGAGMVLKVEVDAPFDWELKIDDAEGRQIGYRGNQTPRIWVEGGYGVTVKGYGNECSDKPFKVRADAAGIAFPPVAMKVGKPLTATIIHGGLLMVAQQWGYVLQDAEWGVQITSQPDQLPNLGQLLVVMEDAELSTEAWAWLRNTKLPAICMGESLKGLLPAGSEPKFNPVMGVRGDLANTGSVVWNIYYRKNDPPPVGPWPFYLDPRYMTALGGAETLGLVRCPDGVLVGQVKGGPWYWGLTAPPRYGTAELGMLLDNIAWYAQGAKP